MTLRILLSLILWVALAPASAAGATQPEVLAALRGLHQQQLELTERAAERAERPGVRDLAQALHQDYAGLDKWMDALGVSPATPGPTPTDGPAALWQLEGTRFDQAFLRYEKHLTRRALGFLDRHRPASTAQSEYANHLKITREALRKHLALIQAEQDAAASATARR